MHSCSTLCPAVPSSSVHFYQQQLNVFEINPAPDFASIQSYADNTEALVRVDSTSPVACTDACTQAFACIDVEAQAQALAQALPFINANAQAQILPCNNNFQAQGHMRLCIPAEEEEEMHAQYSHAQEQAQTTAYVYHAQAASCREQRVHDLLMQRGDRYSNAQEEGYVRVQRCLPPMSSTLIECIESARGRVMRCRRMWTMMQLMSTVSQILGVLLVLGLCSKEEMVVRHNTMSSPLSAWALGYALGCLALLPLFYKHSQSTGSHDLLNVDENRTHDNRVVVAEEAGEEEEEEEEEEEAVEKRVRRCVDFFFGIWFVLGVVWVFGRPSCALASPKLYSLCVTLLMLSGLRYLMPLILCCALCCCLQPTTLRISNGFNQDGGAKKGATQEHIDATLPIFKFKHRWPINNNLHKETFSIATMTIAEKSICKDGMEYCCICLKRYKEDAKLRGLPCSHYFHVDCVDQWLKINASCPLCKFSIKGNKLHPFPFF